ncbi:carbohydrate kinase [Flavobacteriaceae bacterium]|nr:carbohydrate kinase [Flavobacteriaceae bacterium]
MSNIVCFGEVLWDVFPSYKKIGGAPLNVALRLNSFNNNVTIISSIGNDTNGIELLNYIKKEGLNSSYIQVNKTIKTSAVIVSLDASGSASYCIEFPCAWDYVATNESNRRVVKNSKAFVFGSLIARNEESYMTLLKLLNVAPFKVFDVNLRPPHYQLSVLEELMQIADFIKFNDDELFEICKAIGFNSNDLTKNIEFISDYTKTDLICVTLGAKGAVFYLNNLFYFNNGYKVKVVDTVGAGDSFLAGLIDKFLRNEHPQKAIDFACAVGALVASNVGANPEITNKLEKFINGL